MMFFAQELLWESQMSTHTTALSDLGDALMIQGFEANTASLKRCESFKTPLMRSGVMTHNLLEYGSPTIFMYDLDLGKTRTLNGIWIDIFDIFQVFLDCW